MEMNSYSDRLFQIFNKFLNDLTRPQQTHDDLIFDVVAHYIFELMNRGNIPQSFLDQLEFDLTEEVKIMYQKKTYGFLTLQEYRDAKVKTSN